jgi:ribosomal protein S18 acetylase RimI-like enzyme
LDYSVAGRDGQVHRLRTVEVTQHDAALIKTVVDIDLMTWSEQTFSRYTAGLMLRYGRTFLLLADDVPIGTCQCVRTWERPSEAVLFTISIRPGWRGRGLGTSFVQQVCDALARSGTRSVVLHVDASNHHGIRIYEDRFGFSVAATLVNEYGNGRDQVLLRKILQSPDTPALRLEPND